MRMCEAKGKCCSLVLSHVVLPHSINEVPVPVSILQRWPFLFPHYPIVPPPPFQNSSQVKSTATSTGACDKGE